MAIDYVTLNPNDKNGSLALSNGNLTVISTDGSLSGNIRATHGKSTGKWYWEIKLNSGATGLITGIANKSYPITSAVFNGTTGDTLNFRAFFPRTSKKFPEDVVYGKPWAIGDVIGVALDLYDGTLTFYINGLSMGVSHTNVKSMGEVFPFLKDETVATKTYTVNFGATTFAYPIPNGHLPYVGANADKILLLSSDEKIKSIEKGGYTDNLIPAMTSNTSHGTATASSEYTATFAAWKAFDDNVSSAWAISGGSGWLCYDFHTDKVIDKYSLISSNTIESAPKDWSLTAWDGNRWIVLDERINVTWSAREEKEYSISKPNIYSKYRININSNNGNSLTQVGEFKLFSRLNPIVTHISSQSEQSFINHGMSQSDLASIDMSADFTEKHYIQDVSTVLGSGKVFEQALDVNKVLKSIKIK